MASLFESEFKHDAATCWLENIILLSTVMVEGRILAIIMAHWKFI